jgi:hypothetical protein
VFQEGILVTALRNGYWIILDELNLAPSEVLEALNRLLDDNRELYISETQETVKPHPHFRLFATQNPAGAYGGRKALSRAFRNRFVEIHMGDIPNDEVRRMPTCRREISPPQSPPPNPHPNHHHTADHHSRAPLRLRTLSFQAACKDPQPAPDSPFLHQSIPGQERSHHTPRPASLG